MLRPLKIILAALFATVMPEALGAGSGPTPFIRADDNWNYRGSIDVKPPHIKGCEGLPCDRWCTKYACAHGEGKLITDGGEWYSGSFAHGFFHGHGVYDSDWYVYVGGFRNGKQNGHGILSCGRFRKYEGTFVDGTMHGNFTVTAPGGTTSMVNYDHVEYDRFGGPCEGKPEWQFRPR